MKTSLSLIAAAVLLLAVLLSGFAPDPTTRYPQRVAFTIAQNGTTSPAVNMNGCTFSRLVVDANWDAATISILADDGTGYQAVVDQFGSPVSIYAASNKTTVLDPAGFWNFGNVELVASASQTTAAHTLYVVCQNAR